MGTRRTHHFPRYSEKPLTIASLKINVLLEMEWSEELIDNLPSDLMLQLTSDKFSAIEKSLSKAARDNGLVHVEFEWNDPTSSTTLTAISGDQTITLWKDQVVGSGENAPEWEKMLEDLLPPEIEDSESETILVGQTPTDLGPLEAVLKIPFNLFCSGSQYA